MIVETVKKDIGTEPLRNDQIINIRHQKRESIDAVIERGKSDIEYSWTV